MGGDKLIGGGGGVVVNKSLFLLDPEISKMLFSLSLSGVCCLG